MTTEIQDHLNHQVFRALEAFNKLGALEPVHDGCMKVTTHIYPIKANSEGECFLPTGTKTDPKGFSKESPDMVLIHTNFAGNFRFYMFQIEDFKKKLKKVPFNYSLDEEYEVMGYKFKIQDLLMLQ